MKIGIDIDGVVLDFERLLRVETEIYDILKLGDKGIKNAYKFRIEEKYNWNQDDIDGFINTYFTEVSEKSKIVPGAKRVIDILKKENNELVVISARGLDIPIMKEIAEKKLQEDDITFDKCYYKVEDKLKICKVENIALMIDDSPDVCKILSDNNIKVLYLRDISSIKLEENENLKEVHNWGEIYRYIHSMNKK